MLRLSTVILAAGASKRLGYNKLCVRIDGEAVIRRTVRLFMEAGTGAITVVTGNERERIEAELAGLPVAFVHNPRHEDGMAASIKAATAAISGSDLVLFHLGDKPFVTRETIERVVGGHGPHEGGIIVPVYQGVKGHPVLIDVRKHLAAAQAVSGEGGLRDVVAENAGDVLFVEADEGAVLDLDTEDDMTLLRRRGYTIEKG
jgi:molybdenum cofactor cytidylyltransferase